MPVICDESEVHISPADGIRGILNYLGLPSWMPPIAARRQTKGMHGTWRVHDLAAMGPKQDISAKFDNGALFIRATPACT